MELFYRFFSAESTLGCGWRLLTTRQISDTIEEIYGFEVSDGMAFDITDRLLLQIEDWQNRPLDAAYPIVFIDAVHFSVRDNGQIRKLAAYVILAVSLTGHKEVLSIHIGENESVKYWLGVLNELKNRGVKDVLVICADGLSGIKEAINAAFPLNKQRSVFPSDTALLKALYLATHEITKKWTMPLRNWGRVLGELEIMYPDRLN